MDVERLELLIKLLRDIIYRSAIELEVEDSDLQSQIDSIDDVL